MQEKSIGKNAGLNMFKTVITLVFPLITFPYISRVLQVENLGKVNFANSIVNYFVLFATLGLKTYGVREGAIVRNNKDKFQKFFSEVFTITIVSTIISLIVLGIISMIVPSLTMYRILILILSISVILPTIGSEWICSTYEDYGYITLRSILVQIISFILIFILIHQPKDYYLYAFILVFSSQGSNIFNLFYVKKYVKFKLTTNMNLKTHMKPMLILFASTLATSIYVSSDTTVLGLICGDYYTGLYSSASKLYSVLKNLVSSIVVVAIPRFSFYYNNNKKKQYNDLLNNISNILALLVIPIAVGVFLLSDYIIIIISGKSYSEAASALSILAIAVVFVGASWIMSQCILIPMKMEKIVLYTTILTALLNIGLNCLLVGTWKHNAAAFTTVISEMMVVLIYAVCIRNKVKIIGLSKELLKSFIACIVMAIEIIFIRRIKIAILFKFPVIVIVSVLLYYIVLILLKDQYVIDATRLVVEKGKRTKF